MHKRIEELARGKFDCTEPILAFSTDRIILEVLEGNHIQGEFEIYTENDVTLRGRVYSSNPRMECLVTGFEGERVRIRYEFHSEGLSEGDIQKGEFFVVCNHAEYNLSFVVTIFKHYADTSIGSVRNLHDFTKLARENWQEAKKVFYSPRFKDILGKESPQQILYEGLAKVRSDLNLEEFLLACDCKQKVECSADMSNAVFYEVKEPLQYQIHLEKNTWGYTEFEIISDAAFLQTEKTRITMDDFVGMACNVNYYLLPEQMHEGKNYATLVLSNVNQQIVLSICASRNAEEVGRNPNRQETKYSQTRLINLYMEYRLKKIVTGKWAKSSIDILDELVVKNPAEVWYRLLKAQIFFMNGQRQEAEWILSEFKREWKDKKSPEWGYYLYICTLMEREDSYVDKLIDEIEQIYMRNKEHPFLFLCMLFLQEEYTSNPFHKLKTLRERILSGYESPILYVETFCLYRQDVCLLNHFGEFELKVLNWARKQKVLTKELLEQFLSVLPERLEYNRQTMLLLETCYEKLPEEETLATVCGYLIKNQKYGKRFFPWYEKGVEEKLRLTGLYEAYLLSMDQRNVLDVPKIILMYFKYNTQLGYRQKAALYVNIIANKEKKPEDYEQYRQTMEVFAYEQMELGHMDDNLAVIYNEVVKDGVHSRKLAEVLANVLFVHKLTCFDKNVVRAIVTDRALAKPQVVAVTGGVAYFKLFSTEYSIMLEDHRGNRYCSSISYQLEKLMYPAKYIRDCMYYAPEELPYILAYFSSRKAVEYFEQSDIAYFRIVMNAPQVSEEYQSWLCAKMIRLLHDIGNIREIDRYLAKLDYAHMDKKNRKYLVDMLTEHELYELAYHIGLEYGRENFSQEGWRDCISSEIRKSTFAEEERLLSYAAELFMQDSYDVTIVDYLCRYYESTTKTMEQIWKASQESQIKAHELEERILGQMLYTAEYIESVAAIYQSYAPEGNPLLKQAYLNYFAYSDFVRDMIPPEHLYEDLFEQYQREKTLPVICELALFAHLAGKTVLSDGKKAVCEQLLQKYLYQGMVFAFYRKLEPALLNKYRLYDKTFVEYKTTSAQKVQIRYKLGNDRSFVTEEMNEVYEGIYVHEFIIFSGEKVQYYILEEKDGQMMTTESGLLDGGEGERSEKLSRYGRLNEMFALRERGDMANLAARINEYKQLQQKTEQLFTIL